MSSSLPCVLARRRVGVWDVGSEGGVECGTADATTAVVGEDVDVEAGPSGKADNREDFRVS